ncbi:hypothetical protein LCGC14_2822620 [marine sediment metagenome]|uniref:Uncharacterized protein n=1 Tax=marine sediment metagenome TaxID=412755 RepID=A0A0F8YGK0_9ZZZZ
MNIKAIRSGFNAKRIEITQNGHTMVIAGRDIAAFQTAISDAQQYIVTPLLEEQKNWTIADPQ